MPVYQLRWVMRWLLTGLHANVVTFTVSLVEVKERALKKSLLFV